MSRRKPPPFARQRGALTYQEAAILRRLMRHPFTDWACVAFTAATLQAHLDVRNSLGVTLPPELRRRFRGLLRDLEISAATLANPAAPAVAAEEERTKLDAEAAEQLRELARFHAAHLRQVFEALPDLGEPVRDTFAARNQAGSATVHYLTPRRPARDDDPDDAA